MRRLLTTCAFSAALALTLASGTFAADEPSGGTVDDMADVVNVDSVTARPVAGTDGAAELVVSGTLPSSCHQPVWEVLDGPDAVQVFLWAWPGDDPACEATLAPFELTIPLGQVSADSTVLLDGEPVGWLSEVVSDPVTALTGAGSSFGMCLGMCATDIEFDGDQVVMTGHDREQAEPVFTNDGQLTADGVSRIDAAIAALGDAPLEPVYGCPDCADGGAAYLSFQRDGGETTHEMEFANPPAELSELYDLAVAIGDALQLCRSSELVTVADDCVVG